MIARGYLTSLICGRNNVIIYSADLEIISENTIDNDCEQHCH